MATSALHLILVDLIHQSSCPVTTWFVALLEIPHLANQMTVSSQLMHTRLLQHQEMITIFHTKNKLKLCQSFDGFAKNPAKVFLYTPEKPQQLIKYQQL